jgi:hypothetical protein
LQQLTMFATAAGFVPDGKLDLFRTNRTTYSSWQQLLVPLISSSSECTSTLPCSRFTVPLPLPSLEVAYIPSSSSFAADSVLKTSEPETHLVDLNELKKDEEPIITIDLNKLKKDGKDLEEHLLGVRKDLVSKGGHPLWKFAASDSILGQVSFTFLAGIVCFILSLF